MNEKSGKGGGSLIVKLAIGMILLAVICGGLTLLGSAALGYGATKGIQPESSVDADCSYNNGPTQCNRVTQIQIALLNLFSGQSADSMNGSSNTESEGVSTDDLITGVLVALLVILVIVLLREVFWP